jgi:hypothetical protein
MEADTGDPVVSYSWSSSYEKYIDVASEEFEEESILSARPKTLPRGRVRFGTVVKKEIELLQQRRDVAKAKVDRKDPRGIGASSFAFIALFFIFLLFAFIVSLSFNPSFQKKKNPGMAFSGGGIRSGSYCMGVLKVSHSIHQKERRKDEQIFLDFLFFFCADRPKRRASKKLDFFATLTT